VVQNLLVGKQIFRMKRLLVKLLSVMKTFRIILLVLTALLFAGCATNSTKTLTEFDNNKHINLMVGQLFVVKLPSNSTTGYRWNYQNGDNAVIEMVGSPSFQIGSAPVGTVGGGSTEFFTFRAKSVGQENLKFEYSRLFGGGIAPEQTVSYDLVVGN
jgi:inhibitor of cysteine peptidase